MITPEQQADKLIKSFTEYAHADWNEQKGFDSLNHNAIKCAIACVDEIIDELKEWGAPFLFEDAQSNDWGIKRSTYWQQVKQLSTDKLK